LACQILHILALPVYRKEDSINNLHKWAIPNLREALMICFLFLISLEKQHLT